MQNKKNFIRPPLPLWLRALKIIMPIILALLAALLAFIQLLTPLPSPPPPPICILTFQGTAINRIDRKPIPNAIITTEITIDQSITDAIGLFELSDVKCPCDKSSLSLQLQLNGESVTRLIDIPPKGPDNLIQLGRVSFPIEKPKEKKMIGIKFENYISTFSKLRREVLESSLLEHRKKTLVFLCEKGIETATAYKAEYYYDRTKIEQYIDELEENELRIRKSFNQLKSK